MEVYQKDIASLANYLISRKYKVHITKINICNPIYLVFADMKKSKINLVDIVAEFVPNIDIILQDVPVIKINYPNWKLIFKYRNECGGKVNTLIINVPAYEETKTIGAFDQYLEDFDEARELIYSFPKNWIQNTILKVIKGQLTSSANTYIKGKIEFAFNKEMI